MCDECRCDPCDHRCPNAPAPAPEVVYTCEACHDDIVEGETYYELKRKFYHEECSEDEAVNILVNQCGAEKDIAEALEYDWEGTYER